MQDRLGRLVVDNRIDIVAESTASAVARRRVHTAHEQKAMGLEEELHKRLFSIVLLTRVCAMLEQNLIELIDCRFLFVDVHSQMFALAVSVQIEHALLDVKVRVQVDVHAGLIQAALVLGSLGAQLLVLLADLVEEPFGNVTVRQRV